MSYTVALESVVDFLRFDFGSGTFDFCPHDRFAETKILEQRRGERSQIYLGSQDVS